MRSHIAYGRQGVIVSGHPHASAEAVNVLRRGGNAVDAAGSPGTVGQTCIMAQVMAQVMAAILEHRADPGEMIDAPRWSVPENGNFILEESASPALRDDLFAAMPRMQSAPEGSVTFGSIKATIARGGHMVAVANLRRVAGAQGW